MTKYNLEDFKTWLEINKTNNSGMEEHWKYFLDWYKENLDIWEATVERGMRSAGYEHIKFEKWTDYEKEVENLYTTIFIWKREVDSSQKRSIITSSDHLRQSCSYTPIVQRTEEEKELREEIRQLKSDIQREKSKNQENQEKITKLEQEIINLNLRREAKQLAEIIDLQQQLKLAQDQVKELESSLRIAIQTSEIATQTNFGWDEELRQKDLKIEQLKQQSTKQNKLSIKTQEINRNLGDASWMDLSTETGNKPLSPSQIRAREKQKKQNQEQSQQAQIIQPTHGILEQVKK